MAEPRLFDAHFHIVDPRFPLQSNCGYLPEPFSVRDYRRRLNPFPLCGGAVVSASFQGFDQSYLLAALEELGPNYVGVTQLPVTTNDSELLRLDRAGIRAVRFNVHRGGSEAVEHLERMAFRVHEVVGWHVELYLDSRHLRALADMLRRLPAVSIDHLGLSGKGLPMLLRLADEGIHVKASGFGRTDFDVVGALRLLHAANPECLMFGSDLPSTRAPRPFRNSDLKWILEALGESGAERVLHRNAISFYRPRGRGERRSSGVTPPADRGA